MIIRCLFFMAFLLNLCGLSAQNFNQRQPYEMSEPAATSVLASGKWFKIKIYSDGIYRLSFEDLKNLGFSNPSDIRLFGNGGTMLPLMNSVTRYDDLIENTVYMFKGTDDIFNEGDYILFYGKGPVTWNYNPVSAMFEHKVHQYSRASYYFLTDEAGNGLKIANQIPVSGTPDIEITEYDDYDYHEKNKYNFLKSGRQWFGERIDYTDFDTTFSFAARVSSSPVKVKVNVMNRSAFAKAFSLLNNGTPIGTIVVPPVILSNTTGTYANQKSAVYSFSITGDQVNLKLSYNKTESTDEGYLDYITVNVRRSLTHNGNALFFRNQPTSGTNAIAAFIIENCDLNTEVWDITDRFNIGRVPAQLSGSTLVFSDSTRLLKEYVVLNTGASFSKPEMSTTQEDLGLIPNQNLHAASAHQMLIVTHPLFIAAADSIAQFHRQKDNYSVLVATTDQIYNEFSSGAPDVSAIRDFARMIYNRSTGEQDKLKYLLLLGDGSYNNYSKDAGNSNFILTYQSENSLNASMSYVSDDFFGLLDGTEGGDEAMENYTLDLGVGRLPAKNPEEAMALYRKIRNYGFNNHMGDWRNNILFVADDEDGNLHMTQADGLAGMVGDNYPQFAIKKVMLDAYHQVSSSSGARYPDVNQVINNNIEKGILIFNYTGHGGETGLASERILTREELMNYTNSDRLPLFVTATCEFSRFDDLTDNEGDMIEKTSAGELSLVNPQGGSIALLSTTRIVYSNDNHNLNTKFYEVIFEKDGNGNYHKLGDVIKMTKNASGENRNKLNFILLGDPALSLAIPKYSILTDSLNGISIIEPIDTLKAFSRIRFAGHLEDAGHQLLSSFNGTLYPSVFDKTQTVTTLANDNGTPLQFNVRENLLYKGKASVINGRFSFEFVVPKDITYSFGKGKIIYYSSDPDQDANGSFSEFIIGGTDPATLSDLNGPEISLFLNDVYFNNMGITNPNPVIFAKIADESGINTIGNGIGHDITGIIDGDVTNPVVMNDYFEANLDDYRSGNLTYQMENLTEGWHSLKVKVWDVFNNSSEKIIEFRVLPGNSIVIANAGNYPNPAIDHTFFRFEHNKPGEELDVTISIFDMGGRQVNVINETIITGGFNSSPMEWDLKDTNGNTLKQGIYPYRIRITDVNGSYTDSYQKLVVIRQ